MILVSNTPHLSLQVGASMETGAKHSHFSQASERQLIPRLNLTWYQNYGEIVKANTCDPGDTKPEKSPVKLKTIDVQRE